MQQQLLRDITCVVVVAAAFLSFCLFVFLLIWNFTILLIPNFTHPKFYSSKILLLWNFTPPKWLLVHAACSYCVTSLVRSSAQQKAFSRANNRFNSLRRKDYANVDHRRRTKTSNIDQRKTKTSNNDHRGANIDSSGDNDFNDSRYMAQTSSHSNPPKKLHQNQMNYLSEEFPTQVSSLVVAVLKKVSCFNLAKKVSFTNSMLWKGFILLYRFVSVLNEL